MRARSLSDLSDKTLLQQVSTLLARDRIVTAELLLHLAEVDTRRLYVPAGYPSMHAFCVAEWRMSEEVAYKRIQAARVARRFPIVIDLVAEGRLNASGVVLLAPYLTPGNAESLFQSATLKTLEQVRQTLAERFPRSESLPLITRIAPQRAETSATPAPPLGTNEPPTNPFEARPASDVQSRSCQLDSNPVVPRPMGEVQPTPPPTRIEPIAPERFSLSLTMSRRLRDKLRYAQELMSHQGGDAIDAIERGLDLLITKLEKRKFAASDKPRIAGISAKARRTVTAHVRRAVWKRDGGQCTFVGESGRRCGSRQLLEYDHIEPVARGGEATVENLRLRCRAHNQYAAEVVFGAAFMANKRERRREA